MISPVVIGIIGCMTIPSTIMMFISLTQLDQQLVMV